MMNMVYDNPCVRKLPTLRRNVSGREDKIFKKRYETTRAVCESNCDSGDGILVRREECDDPDFEELF